MGDCAKRGPYTRNMCPMHYTRWIKHGDPLMILTTAPPGSRATGVRSGNWTGDDATYYGVHKRVKASFGVPSTKTCVDCGKRADHWSYDGLAGSDEKRDPRGLAYTTLLHHYEPRCASCHRLHDLPPTCPQGHLYTEANTKWKRLKNGVTGRLCRECTNRQWRENYARHRASGEEMAYERRRRLARART